MFQPKRAPVTTWCFATGIGFQFQKLFLEPLEQCQAIADIYIVLDALDEPAIWPALFVRWELGLLDELGFGLDLAQCAATGAREDLIYVSPRTDIISCELSFIHVRIFRRTNVCGENGILIVHTHKVQDSQ